MARIVRYIDHAFGLLQSAVHVLLVLSDFFKFRRGHDNRFSLNIIDLYPCVTDKTAKTQFDRHYVYHTAWAARKVQEINPEYHTDISSSLYFSALVSAFVPVHFYDYRPADLKLSNLVSKNADILALPFADNSIASLSCMHVVEHIGLGRYGDTIDPSADIKAINELIRVLAPSGYLLFVVPLGKARIQFNAHRIYAYQQILEYFRTLHLSEFVLIPQYEKDGGILYNATEQQADKESYGCGCFLFKK